MKKLFLLLLVFPLVISAQNTEEQISQIRKWYNEIETNLEHCTQINIDDWTDKDNNDEGTANLTVYFDNETNQFIKVEAKHNGDWHEEMTSYYLNNGSLFFIFSEGYYGSEFYTAKELGMDENTYYESGREAKTISHYEERKYFANGKCIKYLSKSKDFSAKLSKISLADVNNKEELISDVSYEYHSDFLQKMLASAKGSLKK